MLAKVAECQMRYRVYQVLLFERDEILIFYIWGMRERHEGMRSAFMGVNMGVIFQTNKKASESWLIYFGNQLILLVGAGRFELPTPCTPCKYATRLRYAPRARIIAELFTFLEAVLCNSRSYACSSEMISRNSRLNALTLKLPGKFGDFSS
jgi:hypothetical protein